MTNPPLSLPLYLLSAPLFYIPSLHPYFTPYLPPIYIYPPHASPPFDTPSLRLYSSTLHSLSVLPIYPPLYHPTLQPLSRTHSPTGYKSTPPYVLLYLLTIPCFYIPSLYPFFTQSLPVTHTLLTLPIYVHTLHSLSILLIYPPLYHPTLQPPDSPYFKIRSLHSHSSLSLSILL